jgi:ATP-binding protein involved in chromosome partitioning
VSRKPLSRQRVGYRLHGGAQRLRGVAGGHLHGERAAEVRADVVGDLLGLDGVDDGQQAGQQRKEKIVPECRHCGGRVNRSGVVSLGGTADPGPSVIDVDVEVTAGSQFVEVMAGHVRVKCELFGHLGRCHALAFTCEEVDLPARAVAERRRDRGHRCREPFVCAHPCLYPVGGCTHTVIVPVAAQQVRTRAGSTEELRDRSPGREMTVPDQLLEEAVRAVVDPGLFHTLGDLGLIRSVHARRRSTEVVVAVPAAGHPAPRELVAEIAKAVAAAGGAAAEVDLVDMSEAEESDLRARLHELGRGHPSGAGNEAGSHAHDHGQAGPHAEGGRHGADGPTPRVNPFADKASRTRVVAVASGKGGVGKSTVTVNLAIALAQRGASVAILDADVYGFSIPSMLGIDRPPTLLGDLLVPPVAYGVRCISMGFFVDEDQAVMWRGPMLHKALEQFLVDVHWGSPDFLLLDLPPGTGDVAMSIAQFLPRAEVLVVTTPQAAAERVAQRAAVLARQLRLPVRGVVENQSWFTGDDGTRYELFGRGGGELLAESLGVALLAQIPFLPSLREGGDSGLPIMASDPGGDAGLAFAALAERVVALGPGRVYRSELSVR